MAIYLILDESNIVINIIEWDGKNADHLSSIKMVKGSGSIGWKWDGQKAIDPNPPPPPSITINKPKPTGAFRKL